MLVLLVGVRVVGVADAQCDEVFVAKQQTGDHDREGEFGVLLHAERHALLRVRRCVRGHLPQVVENLDHTAGEVQRVAEGVDV